MAKFSITNPGGRPKGARNKLTAQVYADVVAFGIRLRRTPSPRLSRKGARHWRLHTGKSQRNFSVRFFSLAEGTGN